jgi:hypothetical protein
MADARENSAWRLRPPSLLPVDEVEFALSLAPIGPPAPGDLDAATREKLESRYLRVPGRALFDDVARAVNRARADVATPLAPRAEGAPWPRREARVDIVCPKCGTATSSAVYQARRSEELRCRSCDAAIGLRSEEFQRERDLAEREWQAEKERQGARRAGSQPLHPGAVRWQEGAASAGE